MERKQIQFTRQQLTGLRREAKRKRTSESAIVREAVDAWLAAKGESARHERFARAMSVVGKFRSGKHDIAREHDRELAEILSEELREGR